MKSLILLPGVVLLVACCTNPDTVTYQQVTVTPCCKQVAVTACCRQVTMRPSCCQQQVTVINNDEPIDVTTIAVDYY